MHPVETYLKSLSEIHRTGGGSAEESYYGPLESLLNEIGHTLKPKVRCVSQLKNTGAGEPDFGLYTAEQFQRSKDDRPLEGALPARGVIEAKAWDDNSFLTARKEQVSKYWNRYGLVLVTNYHDFVLVGRDAEGHPVLLESYRMAKTLDAFRPLLAHPHKAAQQQGDRLLEFLRRVLLHAAPLALPADVAWFLASYARDALARVENAGDLPALAAVRGALEEALGARFEGERGEHFFRSTLVQTLFYGVFSAWVLWSREHPPTDRESRFDWRAAAWSLRVPMIRALFEDLAKPSKLAPLGLVEVLDWTATALSRVDRAAFFKNFQDEHAVQYFYEPFLEAFDPELRKELGVWYTPPEIVRYMVARVDTALREELDIPDGLADPRVVVLDPCCGTGAYLVETLRNIGDTLRRKGGDALVASDLRKAARERVFGFELLPAPFVVAHLQIGLLLQNLGAPLSEKKDERAGVFLTNALTGWEPPQRNGQRHVAKALDLFPEMQAERDAANAVKRDQPILVILGNPPYNGFAGMAVEEERDLTEAYRTTKKAPSPQGQGLNDLYVRFFRMAERKIVEGTRKGVVCFISNYSWLDGLSHTGMREHFLEVFDGISVDCLNGDKYKTGKLTPEGEPDPSIFSTERNREGIQVGTALALLVRRERHQKTASVRFRHLWGKTKRQQILQDASAPRRVKYQKVNPPLEIGLPFLPSLFASDYISWPLLPDLFPVSFPGVKTSRDDLLVDIDREKLEERMRKYFDPNVSHEEMRRICPVALENTARFAATEVRERLCQRGFIPKSIVPYSYRPFDSRWLYWEPDTKLLDEKRTELWRHASIYGNVFLVAQQKPRREWSPPQLIRHLGCIDLMDRSASCFPLVIQHGCDGSFFSVQEGCEPASNLSPAAEKFLAKHKVAQPSALYHALATLHSPLYQTENAGALRQDWPRVPLPNSGRRLAKSAALGRRLAALLDPEAELPNVTAGDIRPDLREMGVFSLIPRHTLDEENDLALTAGWGHGGKGGVTMPGRGNITERPYSAAERDAIAAGVKALGIPANQAFALLGENTRDVWLNENAFWRNVPARVWDYTLGGYQVIKKWLSYRERELLGRPLRVEEVREITAMVRRIAALLLLHPELDANYQAVKSDTYSWNPANSHARP